MIGKAYVSTFPFYNRNTKCMGFKNRLVLVVGQADLSDYVILPISRVTEQANLDKYYDFRINPEDVPLMNLHSPSYIRTHKQSIVNVRSLTSMIVDFREKYNEQYVAVIAKMEEFQRNLINRAL